MHRLCVILVRFCRRLRGDYDLARAVSRRRVSVWVIFIPPAPAHELRALLWTVNGAIVCVHRSGEMPAYFAPWIYPACTQWGGPVQECRRVHALKHPPHNPKRLVPGRHTNRIPSRRSVSTGLTSSTRRSYSSSEIDDEIHTSMFTLSSRLDRQNRNHVPRGSTVRYATNKMCCSSPSH
jgi:hypothetical protein